MPCPNSRLLDHKRFCYIRQCAVSECRLVELCLAGWGRHLALWAVAVDEHLAVPLRCLSASLALRASEGPANAQPEPRP